MRWDVGDAAGDRAADTICCTAGWTLVKLSLAIGVPTQFDLERNCRVRIGNFSDGVTVLRPGVSFEVQNQKDKMVP